MTPQVKMRQATDVLEADPDRTVLFKRRAPPRRVIFHSNFWIEWKSSCLSIGLIVLILSTYFTGSYAKGSIRRTRSYPTSRGSSRDEVPARPNIVKDTDVVMEPHFDNSTEKNVTTQVAKTAFLHCRVRNLGDRSVSWIRLRDLHVLTVNRYTYTNDQRFQAIHQDNTDDWTLQIKYPQRRDAGIYECQVSTEPKIKTSVTLNVVVATARILGMSEIHIKSGSTINLTCIITQSHMPQSYVFWHHNGKGISYDSPRGGVNVVTTKGDTTTTSQLLITNAKPVDSGNYTCEPSNANTASVTVHVLNGEKPGALREGMKEPNVGVSLQPSYTEVIAATVIHSVWSALVMVLLR